MKTFNSILKSVMMFLLLSSPVIVCAQDNDATPKPPTNQPVKGTFENAVLINNQTVESPSRKSLDFIIEHRFGVIDNSYDMYGIYAPSNIRLGLDYGITKRLAVGVGATKNKMIYDLNWKYVLLKQTKPSGMPVSVSYYGDLARSAQDQSNFINSENNYKGTNRLSYFHELMIARKFNSRVSLQVAATYSHYNIIDSLMKEHDYIGASFLGRYKFSPQSSVIVEFDQPVTMPQINKPKPNLGLGVEISTGSHQFQLFVCTSNGIINQEIRVFNQNDFTKREVMIGFNITRQWGL